MSNPITLEFLSAQGLLSEEIEYCGDDDGNIQIHQSNNYITLTPRQCLDLRELLSAHLDAIDYVTSKKVIQVIPPVCDGLKPKFRSTTGSR